MNEAADNPNVIESIAIIGMAGRFPCANDIETFWQNLLAGREAITTFSDAELTEAGVNPDAVRDDPSFVRRGGVLEDADCFDAGFFDITPREAQLTDPQHRVLMEVAWHTLENAGYVPENYDGSIGVFAGKARNNYYPNNLLPNRDTIPAVDDLVTELGNEMDYMPSRISYKLNLTGPSVSIQTACSTSLVAVYHACQSLLNYHCDMALAGGVTVLVPQKRGYTYHEGHFSSPDGHTHAYDASGQGTLFSNGAGMVLLKRYSEAVEDGDSIVAVIRGIAINNDGADKVGYMAPSVNGQAEVVAMAQAIAGVEPDEFSYVEGHGTATPLGDPIEIAGLTQAFRTGTDRNQFCGIGSVKSNIGHLDAAAGVAGLIKCALSVKHGVIPPSINFETPNPKFNIETTPFYVVDKLTEWKTDRPLRLAAASSFGVGGTNAHAVVEQAPDVKSAPPSQQWQLITLSTRNEKTLDPATANLATHFEGDTSASPAAFADAAYTLHVGRRTFPQRRFAVCKSAEDAAEVFTKLDRKRITTVKSRREDRPVVFMFPGQGSQHPDMARQLYETEPVFRDAIDECAQLLEPRLLADIREVMFPDADVAEDAADRVRQTVIAQPAIFIIEYALADLWRSWGIVPAKMIGHSIGEFVAACIAGVFSLEDALTLLATRGELMQSLPGGAMMAVTLSEDELKALMTEELTIAAVNAPNSCVVSGPNKAVEAFGAALEKKDIANRPLHTSHAFHSSMVDPVLDDFTHAFDNIELRSPQIPFISSVSGTWITDKQATDPAYWGRHMRETVRFNDGRQVLAEDPDQILMEVGPGNTLYSLARIGSQMAPARSATGEPSTQVVLSSLGHIQSSDSDIANLLNALGALWAHGAAVDWPSFHSNESRQHVPLPGYPFERKRQWIDPPPGVRPVGSSAPAANSNIYLATQTDVSQPARPETVMNVTEGVPAMPETTPVPTASRKERILDELKVTMEDLGGLDPEDIEIDASFLELGFDSLFLTQATMAFKKTFGVDVTFRQLLEDTPTPEALANFIDAELPADAFQAAPAAPGMPTPAPGLAASPPVDASTVERVIAQQLVIMNQQLAMLGQGATIPAQKSAPTSGSRRPQADEADDKKSEKQKRFGPWKPVDKSSTGMNDTQTKHLDELITGYTALTPKSKGLTEAHRSTLADPRAVAGFKSVWKEMVYPIATERSKGCRLWDIDGNEYVDMTMGFGSVYFGHSPDWVTEAITAQLAKGVEIGPQSPYVGQAADDICELLKMERAAFCNTGSEAVMAAMRLARTVSGRDKVVMFANDYHGIMDEVLVRPMNRGGEIHTLPVAPGIPRDSVANVIVLDYGDMNSIEIMKQHADDIAAVIVEPVQARHPDLQPFEFLKALREWTTSADVALVFDEVITGFRLHPRGAQEFYGIDSDMGTYGKIIGGGMPIGILAGKAKYLDALDGGSWQYGDSSAPEVGVTYFAGTFVRHPLAVAATTAVIKYLNDQGPDLQKRANDRGDQFAQEVNDYIKLRSAPLLLENCGSMSYLNFLEEDQFSALYFYHLRRKLVHIWEHRAIFVTPAHTDADVEFCIDAFKSSIDDMQAGEFLAKNSGGSAGLDPGDLASGEVKRQSLTPAQLELWLATQINDDSSRAFNENLVLKLTGDLNVQALETSLQQLVARHEALRSTFADDGSYQEIKPHIDLDVPFTDLTSVPQDDRESQLADAILSVVGMSFDIFEGPLLRVHLFQVSDQEYRFLLSAHHLICDGWSSGVLLEDLGTLYTAACSGVSAALDAAMQISDYCDWQKQYAATDAAGATEKFWQDRYSDVPEPLELPTRTTRPPLQTFNGETLRIPIDSDIYKGIKKTGAKNGCTLSTTLLAAFKILLARLSGQSDIVVGISLAGQSLVNGDRLVGHCVNMLPMRSHIDGDSSFGDIAQAENSAMLDTHEYQNYTFGQLLTQIKVPRDPSRTPLVSAEFTLEPKLSDLEYAGLTVEVLADPNRYYNKDIFFNFEASPKALSLLCEYNTDLFDAATIEHWMHCFQTLLQSLIDSPDAPVQTLALLDATDGQQVLEEWNDTAATYPQSSIIDQIVAIAGSTPDKQAVASAYDSCTYAELIERAGQIANRLAQAGATPDSIVGICMERSVDAVVALLGIWQTGAAYLPLDPMFPQARLAFMLDDAHVSAVLTDTRSREVLPEEIPGGAEAILVDREIAHIAALPTTPPDCDTDIDALAYLIYTSGSTGQPKGVEITHRALSNFLASMQKTPGITENDVLLSVTTLSFDISALEAFLPLVTGATVVVADYDTVVDGEALINAVDEYNVTIMQATPTTWQLMMAYGWEGHPALKILCGGEAMTQQLAGELIKRGGEVWNMYGPTETTIWSAVHRITSGDEPVSIGTPIDNTQFYVLDETLLPVPVGATGELMIGGDGLARGYYNRTELTAERFIPNPFAPGERLYRTGDRAQYRDDGTLIFVSRLDDQIKLRGFRIELGEIDAVLRRHDAVQDCVTILREDTPGDPRLVAYVISEQENIQQPLREHLMESLPAYMVPAAITTLDQFPLTPNGKLNRKKLPEPAAVVTVAADRDDVQEVSLTQDEQSLAAIWAGILGFDMIEPEDNFFDIGGHSLQAVQVIGQIKKQCGVRVRPTDLMYQTLRQLAVACANSKPDADADTAESSTGGLKGVVGKLKSLVRNGE